MLAIVLVIEKRRDNKNLTGQTGKTGKDGCCELVVASENADEFELTVL